MLGKRVAGLGKRVFFNCWESREEEGFCMGEVCGWGNGGREGLGKEEWGNRGSGRGNFFIYQEKKEEVSFFSFGKRWRGEGRKAEFWLRGEKFG